MDKNIEELKKHIKILSETKKLSNRIMDFLAEGILVITTDSQILSFNHAFVKHLDIQPINNVLTLEALQDHAVFKKILEETKDMDFIHYSRDVEIFSPGKKFLNIRAVCFDRKNNEKVMVYLVQDMSAVKHQQEKDFREKKLGAVLTLGAGIAHELGNPLNSLNIHLQIMKRALEKENLTADIPSLKNAVHVIENEVQRMDAIIRSFLKAIRPESMHFQEIEIVETIHLALESLIKLAEKNRVHINFKPEFERKFLFADSQKIRQAIINITRNAIEAIQGEGKVDVSCGVEEGYFFIRISDNGPGIVKEKINKIFDPFFTTKDTGVGLGLVISYRIIREHDGDISVKSSPGRGATFMIKLPLREYKLKFLESKVKKNAKKNIKGKKKVRPVLSLAERNISRLSVLHSF